MNEHASTLWVLSREGRQVSCLVRLTPWGIEIDLARDGTVVVTRAFEHEEEALAWAEAKRTARAAEGWVPVAIPPEPNV